MKKYINILYIPISKGYGGAERRLARIYNEISEENDWKIVIYSKKDLANEFCRRENVDIQRCIVCETPRVVIRTIKKLHPRLLWFFNVDQISLLLTLYNYFSSLKIVVTVTNFYYSRLEINKRKVLLSFKTVLHRANIIDCLYPSSVDILGKVTKKEKIYTTPTPNTLIDVFKPKEKKNQIVFASRLIKEKNPLLLLMAANQLKIQIIQRKFKVIICGIGPLEQEITEYIEKEKIGDIVEYRGLVDTSDVLPFSKIYISIMSGENYPSQSLIEAISCGNYCIVGKGYDTDKIIEKEFGIIIDVNLEELITALDNAMQKCDEDNRVVDKAVDYAQKRFNKDNTVKYFKTILG